MHDLLITKRFIDNSSFGQSKRALDEWKCEMAERPSDGKTIYRQNVI